MNSITLTRGRAVHGLVLMALVGLSFLVVGQHVRSYPLVSPSDELQHIDYFFRSWDFGVVRSGDMFGEEAMREQACRGIDDEFQVLNPDCDDPDLEPGDFQEAGYNTAYIHPPTYYTLTAIAARPLDAAGFESRVTAGRTVGGLWLAAAVVAAWAALAALGVSLLVRVPLLVTMICAPVTLHATATINPDATALFSGAAALAAVLWWERGRLHWVIPAFACMFAIALKSTNAIGVLVVLAYLGVRYLQRRRGPDQVDSEESGDDSGHRSVQTFVHASAKTAEEGAPAVSESQLGGNDEGGGDDDESREVPPRHGAPNAEKAQRSGVSYLGLIGAVLAGIAIVSIAWVAASGSIGHVDSSEIPMIQRFEADELTYDELRANIVAGFTPLEHAYLPPFLATSHGMRAMTTWGNAIVAAGVVIGLAFSAAFSRMRALAIASLSAVIAAGPALVLVNYVFSGIYVGIPARYALSALPALLVVCAVALERRILLVGAWLLTAWMLVTTLDALF